MDSDASSPMETFETWLLRRVAEAVEAGDVPQDLLAELQTEFAAARERPQAQSHADAVLDIALELAMPVEKVEAGLAALEAQPRAIRELSVRRIAEAWLEGQRSAHRSGQEANSRCEEPR